MHLRGGPDSDPDGPGFEDGRAISSPRQGSNQERPKCKACGETLSVFQIIAWNVNADPGTPHCECAPPALDHPLTDADVSAGLYGDELPRCKRCEKPLDFPTRGRFSARAVEVNTREGTKAPRTSLRP